ncbi:MAG TPA: glycerophosphodiester phosphodiesterase family protein, partial [Limnochordia bacterium]|nr:glycerophosphodiester phosphodiesterase family protein [Limnochordia bacterium]
AKGAGQVGELTLAQLQALDAGSWRDARFAGERIPTLDALCRLMAPTALQLNLELKTRPNPYPGIEAAVHACLKRYGLLARTVISSFNWDSLTRMRALDADLRLGLLCGRPLDWADRADALGAWSLHPQHPYVDADLVQEAHAHRLAILAWTVNNPAEGARLAALGVDGLITDDPGALRA